ncbi:MAG: hypothetical protein Q7T44_10910 [Parvibaculum sp.]|nr:hypothetical protein [Parvibaculum sp.]
MPRTVVAKLVLLAVIASLAACAKQIDPKTLSEATVSDYVPPKVVTSDMATIKGVYTQTPDIFGARVSTTFLVAIDGKFHADPDDHSALPVPSGKHMVAIGVSLESGSAMVPAYVDLKPGRSYVIKYENTGLTLNSINKIGPDKTLWIEDEKSGEIISPKIASNIYDSNNRYIAPAGSTSTITGSTNGELLDKIVAYTQMVDGFVVDGDGRASVMEGEDGRPEYAVPLAPGRHGLALRVAYGTTYCTFPMMFDVKPKTSYVVRFEEPQDKLSEGHLTSVLPFWIEEASTGVIAYPKVDLIFSVGKKFTPEQLGQPATPPATPATAPK